MIVKICNVCNTEKPVSDFHKKRKSYDYACKECKRVKRKEWYKNNKQYEIDRNQKRKEMLRNWVSEIKESRGCFVCDENVGICLDFHHLDSTQKETGIMTAWNNGRSKKTILKEMKKCIVLCSNCHRKIHGGIFTLPPISLIDYWKKTTPPT
jgi:hypothetical protein